MPMKLSLPSVRQHAIAITMTYMLHCSKKTEILEWDSRSFTDCGPEEADAIADEVIKVTNQVECDFKTAEKWTLEKAIDKARVKTQSIVNEALEGYSNLQHAMESWDEFKRGKYEPQDLETIGAMRK